MNEETSYELLTTVLKRHLGPCYTYLASIKVTAEECANADKERAGQFKYFIHQADLAIDSMQNFVDEYRQLIKK